MVLAALVGAVEGRDGVRLAVEVVGIREVVAAAADGLLLGEALGILLEDLIPPPEAAVVAATRVDLEGVALVGVVFTGRDDVLEEERVVRGFTGRNPLVDLLRRSETGAKNKNKH